MYEFRHSDKRVVWWSPDKFWSQEGIRAEEEFRRLLSPWRMVANIVGNLCQFTGIGLILFVTISSSPSVPLQLTGNLLMLTAVSLFIVYQPTLLGGSGKATLDAKEANGTKWRSVTCWQIVDVYDHPGLRAVELEYRILGKNFTKRLGFDPTEVDEGIVTDFLRRVAPEKERSSE